MQSKRCEVGRSSRYGRASVHLGACAAAALLFAPAAGAAQAIGNYTVSVAPEVYQPLPIGGGTAVVLQPQYGDDSLVSVTLPFAAHFYGRATTEVVVTTNGYVTFDTGTTYSSWANRILPNSDAPNDLIAVWWDDTDCSAPGRIQAQELGVAPNREYVVQWRCSRFGNPTASWEAQLWFSEKTTDVKVVYGQASGGTGMGTSFAATMGVENETGTQATMPFACGDRCDVADFPTGQAVTYSWVTPADLQVIAVTGSPTVQLGSSAHFEAEAWNAGGLDALGFGMRFWVSADDILDATDVEIGSAAVNADLTSNQTVVMDLDAPIHGLGPGTYYLLAEVDPLNVVAESDETNNVGVYGTFQLAVPAPHMTVAALTAPDGAQPGDTVRIDWTAKNTGDGLAENVPWAVVVSTKDQLDREARRIHTGTLTVEPLAEVSLQAEVTLPADLADGQYWLGVVIDPDAEQVGDDAVATAPVAVTKQIVEQPHVDAGPGDAGKSPQATGCAAGAGAPGLLGFGLALALLRRRR